MAEQEEFWAGEFGDAYVDRNRDQQLLEANIHLFDRVFAGRVPPSSVLELGANIGMNLRAMRSLWPGQDQYAVEINQKACEQLAELLCSKHVVCGPIHGHTPQRSFELVLTKGVLIHLAPEQLADVYGMIAQTAERYVLICEYYNPTPQEIPYRGHQGKLFRRDFAGEFLDAHPSWQVADYGFVWRRDPVAPQDDITWFLLERS